MNKNPRNYECGKLKAELYQIQAAVAQSDWIAKSCIVQIALSKFCGVRPSAHPLPVLASTQDDEFVTVIVGLYPFIDIAQLCT